MPLIGRLGGIAGLLLLAACSSDSTSGTDSGISPDGGGPTIDGAPVIDAAPTIDAPSAIDARSADAGDCIVLPTTGSITVPGATSATSPSSKHPLVAAGCPATDLSTSSVPYQLQIFCNTGSTPRAFDIRMNGSADLSTATHPDPFMVIYSGMSLPTDLLQCAAGNDDGPLSRSSVVDNFTVPAGGKIAVMATGPIETDFGSYEIVVTAR
jgi:hypothetical protein